ncbi:MAG: M10 family metallopeptidase [Pseudomonadota bacterium]
MQYDSFQSLADQDDGDAAGPLAADNPWSTTSQTVVAYPYTGNYRIDTLLDSFPLNDMSVTSRWNYIQPLGTPWTVTYSFMSMEPAYPDGSGSNAVEGSSGFTPFTGVQKAVAREIFQRLDAELGIALVEVSDSASSYGQIRLGNNNQPSTAGYAWLPNTDGERSGDVWLDSSFAPYLQSLPPGSPQYATMLHEIGHAMGLKHPGNYNAGDPSNQEPGNYLGAAEDNYNFTVMSYADVQARQERDWYGIHDLLALKTLYGQGSWNAGNTPHKFIDADGDILKVINDTSGNDTIDLSALTAGARLDMRPGTFSSVGLDFWGVPAVDNLSIDFYTVIENFIGTNEADVFTVGNNAVSGNGRGGLDTVLFTSTRASYQASATGGTISVTGSGTNDTFTNVERLEFTDLNLAFDFAGNAGKAARILGTIFGQGDNPHPAYASVLLSYLDGSMGYEQLMDGAIDFHLGANHTVSQLVTTIYTNLAGVAPTAQDLAYYSGFITSGYYTEAQFAMEAAATVYADWAIDIVGQSATGLAYS